MYNLKSLNGFIDNHYRYKRILKSLVIALYVTFFEQLI